MPQHSNPDGRPRLVPLLIVALGTAIATPAVQAVPMLPQRIIDAPENSWVKLNDNLWADAWPDADKAASHGSPKGVIRAWSSFAWDSKRGDVILWGGGHANYSGNEVYRWRSTSMNWELGSLPTAVDCNGNDCVTRDGPMNSPISSHTYDNSAYLPVADRFITFGGNKYNLGGSFYMDGHPTGPYLWDPNKADGTKVGGLDGSNRDPSVLGGQMWENRNPWDSLSPEVQAAIKKPTQDSAAVTAVTTIDGKDVIYQSRAYYMLKYTINDVNDASQDTWEIERDYQWSPGLFGQGAAAIDPFDNLMVRSAGSQLYGFDLNRETGWPFKINPLDLSGRFPMDRLRMMGLEYDAVRDRFLLWEGLDEIWALYRNELNQWVIDQIDPSNLIGGINPYDMELFTGILGKWEYAADWDIFLGMYDWETGALMAYKPQGWTPNQLALAGFGGPLPMPAPGSIALMSLALLMVRRRLR